MFYIRVDANEIIGMGHVMRCLSIAEELRAMGEMVTFLTADDKSSTLIESRRFPVLILHTQWNDMEQELPTLAKIIGKDKKNKLLVDSYQVTKKYFAYWRGKVKTVYIDDMAKSIYPVDAVICSSNCWEKFQHQRNYPQAKLLLGPKYTPLRKAFMNCPTKDIKQKVEELLLVSGGTDSYHALEKILARLPYADYQKITVICGIFNMDDIKLQEKYKGIETIKIYKAVQDLKPYMERADLVISAGGMTLSELCAVGTPAISFVLADNQLASVKKYEEDGLIESAGDVREGYLGENVVQLLEKYHDNFRLRMERSRKMQEYIDGYGARRTAKELVTL